MYDNRLSKLSTPATMEAVLLADGSTTSRESQFQWFNHSPKINYKNIPIFS